jgi:hypothetical protein
VARKPTISIAVTLVLTAIVSTKAQGDWSGYGWPKTRRSLLRYFEPSVLINDVGISTLNSRLSFVAG